MLGCTGYSWIWIRSVCALCVAGVGAPPVLLGSMHLLLACTLGASENERTRISEPHGNTHLRPSHPGAYSGRHCIAMQGCSSVCWVSLSESTERSVECHK